MKTAIKVLISVFILGAVLALIGLIIVDFDLSAIGTGIFRDADYTLTESATEFAAEKVVIRVENRNITLSASSDGEFHFKYYQSDYDKLSYSEESGVISVAAVKENKKRWFATGGLSREVRTVVVEVPASFTGDIDVKTQNGGVMASALGSIASLSLHSSNGGITAKGTSVSGEVSLRTSNGGITAERLSCGGAAVARTLNGTISFEKVSAEKIEAKGSNGRIELIKITCPDASAESSNGRIRITLYGVKDDYRTDVDVSNGTIEIDGVKVLGQVLNAGKAKKLKALTSNGSITIDFLGAE